MPQTSDESEREMHPAFEEILLDIQAQTTRAGKAKALETKHELYENVWPMLKQIAEACNTRFEEIEDAVEEYLAEEGNVIFSDLAEPLFGLLAIAKKIAGELLSGDEMNDLRLAQLRQDAVIMQQTIAIVEPMASQAVVAPGGEDDGEEEEGGDEDAAPAGDVKEEE